MKNEAAVQQMIESSYLCFRSWQIDCDVETVLISLIDVRFVVVWCNQWSWIQSECIQTPKTVCLGFGLVSEGPEIKHVWHPSCQMHFVYLIRGGG